MRTAFLPNFRVGYLLVLLLLNVAGCGDWPPIVNSVRDIDRLPTTQASVRARGLLDSEIHNLQRFRNLKDLDFGSGYAVEKAKITDKGLAELAKLNLPLLESLDLMWCDEITEDGLAEVAKLHTLQLLLLRGCNGITDEGLEHLGELQNLKYLDLMGCSQITDKGIQCLANIMSLETILLSGCPKVTAEGVKHLQTAIPQAKIEKNDRDWDENYRN